ncbi:MAG: hypothetical protein GY838_07895 [bacterium]|nr:hypothetical protein [bacterium]
MKNVLIVGAVLLLLAGNGTASAQSFYDKETSIYAEFFGHGGELSVNFEKILAEKITIRVGIGGTGAVFRQGLVTPFGMSYLMAVDDRNFLEFGIGGAYVNIDDTSTDDTYLDVAENQVVGTGTFGYRFLGHYGFTYRLAFTPAVTKDGFQPMGGAAFGYAF